MATWGELLKALDQLVAQGRKDAFDVVRRQALESLYQYTKREVILYASAHLQKPRVPPELLTITNEDIEGFMEVVYGLKGPSIDIILHSPGGRAEAAEAIVKYLRSKFSDIRMFVPHEAMSAATMIACATDRIVMGRQSYMGPIDPQFQLSTPLGIQSVPAQAILDQFARAKNECAQDRANLAVWLPSLHQYGPALLQQCENAIALSRELVSSWLEKWMFRGMSDAKDRAERVANGLADHDKLRTHSRPLDRDYLRSLGLLQIDDLELDQHLQDKVLTVYHATMHTFSATAATKIIENSHGRAFIKQVRELLVQVPGVVPAPPQPRPPPSA